MTRYPDAVEALRRAADVLEQRPDLSPVEYLRDCARELEHDE